MAGPVESYSPNWLSNLAYSNPWRTGQDYARRFLDAFPKTSTLPISTMPPYARRSRRRRIVRRRAMRLRRGTRGRMRRVRRSVGKKPIIFKKIRRANRGFKRAMRAAKNVVDTKYVYDIKVVDGISMTWDTTADATQYPNIVYNSVKISDFPIVDSQLNEITTNLPVTGYTEYRVHKAFVKITPRNYNYIRNASNFVVSSGQHPWIAAWPLTHFAAAPTTSGIPAQKQIAMSNGVKRIPFYKAKATHMPIAAMMEQRYNIVDGSTNGINVEAPLRGMPYIEYKNEAIKNPLLMPSAVWVPKAADANSKLAFDIEYHVIFALRSSRTNVVEL